jgi:predicted outer membrane repeat protein
MKRLLLQMASTALLPVALITLVAGSTVLAQAKVCTLYDHIKAANSKTAVGSCPPGGSHDIITIAEDITLEEPLPAIRGTITIEGGGHSISGDERFRIFDVNGGNLTIKNLRLTEGKADNGGAVRLRTGMLTVYNSSFVSNRSETGGGAIYADGGTVRVNASHFAANCVTRASHVVELDRSRAEAARVVDGDGCLSVTYYWPSPEEMIATKEGDGGAISFESGVQASLENASFRNNKATNGGAIAMLGNDGGLTVTGSSFSGNIAKVDGGALKTESGMIHISNTTFSNNMARSGGVAALESGEIAMTHVTMKDNRAEWKGGAIVNSGGVVKLRNSVIDSLSQGDDCIGPLDQIVGSLSRDESCGNFRSDDPLLGDLTGEPAWHPLGDGSPAIDAADPAFCPEADQRGVTRPHGGGCDIGALESTTAAPPMPEEPYICPLDEQIVAANTDAPFGTCPAGNGPDTFYMIRDITLGAPLPQITSDITIEGNGYTLSGDGRFRIFDVKAGKLTINNLTLADGNGGSGFNENGGAIRLRGAAQVVINDSILRDNQAYNGGAIALEEFTLNKSTRLIINRSRFVGNASLWQGGAIYSFEGGTIAIANSSFVGNRTRRASNGGAISADSALSVDINNSSFIGNIANLGGAIYGGRSSTFTPSRLSLTLTHVTMLDNAGWGAGLYIEENNQGPIRMFNSVIVGRGDKIAHCQARLAQNVGNFIADGSCSPRISGDAMLEELNDSRDYAPMPGSPLIRAADPRFCLATDQMDNARALSGSCDIGAIETIPASRALSDCAVTTTVGLNFRDAPNGNRIGVVSARMTLRALARTPSWLQVEHLGALGWISADYVLTEGNCD